MVAGDGPAGHRALFLAAGAPPPPAAGAKFRVERHGRLDGSFAGWIFGGVGGGAALITAD